MKAMHGFFFFLIQNCPLHRVMGENLTNLMWYGYTFYFRKLWSVLYDSIANMNFA